MPRYNRAMVIPPELSGVLTATPDTLCGAVRFIGTRVPLQALLDSLLAGDSLDSFFEGYPDVSRVQAEAVVKYQQKLMRAPLGLDLAS